MRERFDAEHIDGISFFDTSTKRFMRYIYPTAQYWCAGWIVVKNPSGEWMTLRKATDADLCAINKAVVESHHSEALDSATEKAREAL